MKKIGFFAVVVLSILVVTSTINAKTYTAETKNGKVLSVFSEEKEINKIKIEVANNFPGSANLKEVVKALVVNKEPEYYFQEKHELKNIFPWRLEIGNRFQITYENGIIQSEKIPANTSPKIKESFHGYLITILLAFVLSVMGIMFLELKRNKLALLLLGGLTINIVAAGIAIETVAGALAGTVALAGVGTVSKIGTKVLAGAGLIAGIRAIALAGAIVLAGSGAVLVIEATAGTVVITEAIVSLKLFTLFIALFIMTTVGICLFLRKKTKLQTQES